MTTTLKFNRKVYVIPEEKYTAMVRNREVRDGGETERGGAQSRPPPAQDSTTRDGPLRTLSESADVLSGGPKTHSPESGRGSGTNVEKAEKAEKAEKSEKSEKSQKSEKPEKSQKSEKARNSSDRDNETEKAGVKKTTPLSTHSPSTEGSRTPTISPHHGASSRAGQENAIRRTLFTLLNPKKRRSLMKVYSALFDRTKGRGEKEKKNHGRAGGLAIPGLPARDLFLSLLHTQSERADRPDGYKALYSRLLLNKVPLSYIGNKRLRRVLHYLKNKRSHSHSTGNAGVDKWTSVTEDGHHSRVSRGKAVATPRPQRQRMTPASVNARSIKGETGKKGKISRSRSKNPRKHDTSWVRI